MMPWAQWLHPDVLPQLPVGYLSAALQHGQQHAGQQIPAEPC